MGILQPMAGMLTELPVWQWDGFRVESANGRLGLVEEVWHGRDGEPVELAVRLEDGGRGLLLAKDVTAVREVDRLVVADPRARLLELGAPRLELVAAEGEAPRLRASWSTTGALLPQPRRRPWPAWVTRSAAPAAAADRERPLWRTILVLYGAIALLAALVMTVAFVAAWIATGRAY